MRLMTLAAKRALYTFRLLLLLLLLFTCIVVTWIGRRGRRVLWYSVYYVLYYIPVYSIDA